MKVPKIGLYKKLMDVSDGGLESWNSNRTKYFRGKMTKGRNSINPLSAYDLKADLSPVIEDNPYDQVWLVLGVQTPIPYWYTLMTDWGEGLAEYQVALTWIIPIKRIDPNV